MHELGIATSILETVEREAEKHPRSRFTVVGLRIGEVAGVDVGALSFGWQAITIDTTWEALRLVVEIVPRRNRCKNCAHEFSVQDYDIQCPKCKSFATENLGGDELDIAYIEAEEAADLEGAKA